MKLRTVVATMLLVAWAPAVAEDVARPLTLERVFASPDLSGPQPQSLKLSPDGNLLTSLRPRADERNRFDLWAVDTRTGAERMLVDSKKVGTGAELSEAEKMQRERNRSLTGKTGIVSYDWAPDGRTILVPLDGDLYIADLDGKVRRLTTTAGSSLNPVASPGGGYVSFVRDQNLFVQPLAGGETVRVTSDGGDTIHWGEAEFVADEEMERRTGYWWAPGDKRIAVVRYDESPVAIVSRAAIGADGTKVYQQRYPLAGTPNVLIELWIVSPGRQRPGEGRPGPRHKSCARHLSRSRRLGAGWLGALRPASEPRADRARPPACRSRDRQGDPGVQRARWAQELDQPERQLPFPDGWQHPVVVGARRLGALLSLAEGRWTQLTKGKWDAGHLAGVDEAGGTFVFEARADTVLENQVYRASLTKASKPVRLSEPGFDTSVTANKDASRLIFKRAGPMQPTQLYLANGDGKRLQWVNENRLSPDHPYYPYLAAHRTPTFGTTKASDGSILNWSMITPKLEPGSATRCSSSTTAGRVASR